MCIIVVKPRGQALPSDEIIRKAFVANDDGFGLAFHHEGASLVTIRKGAMKLPQALKMIHAVRKPEQANMILHFRMATQGKICPENCHPFPLSKKRKHLKATHLECPVAIAHNGVILLDEDGDKRFGGIKTSLLQQDLTDTQLFVRYFLVGLGTSLFNRKVTKLIEAYAGGKFAFLSPQQFLAIGDFTEEDGLFYSSLGFKTTYTHTPTTYGRVYAKCALCGGYGEVRRLLNEMQLCRFCFYLIGFDTKTFDISEVTADYPRQSGFGVHSQEQVMRQGIETP